MDNQQFVNRIQEKIERLTGRSIELAVDQRAPNQLQVELDREVPLVLLGKNIYRHAGFARMCIEYAVASIRAERPIDVLEFHLLLGRN